MTVSEKLTTIAENTSKVFEAGKTKEWNDFWDNFFPNSVTNYAPHRFAGAGWSNHTFKPNKDLIFTGAATGLFRQNSTINLKKCLDDCGVTLDLSGATSLNYAFAYGHHTYLPKISIVSAKNETQYMFGETENSSWIVSIDEIEVAETNTFVSSFNYCAKLEHVIFTGTLATNGLNLHWSTKLDKESLLSIINILQDKTSLGGTWTVTLGEENLAKLSDAEKAVATQKGWTLA